MQTLFDLEPDLPTGFSYKPCFITKEEEIELLDVIEEIELHTFIFHGYTATRKVASFGYDYSFDNGRLTKGADIPVAFHFLLEKVANHLGIAPSAFAELLVIEYPIGSVINWHRDAPPFSLIAGISLASDCTFKLRPQDKANQGRSSTFSFKVEKRSLYVMQGEARTDWQHSTAPVKQKRYSITLRTLK